MQIEITRVVTIKGAGSDAVFLYTELIEGGWPFKGRATLKLDVARGGAEEYVAKNFPGIAHEVINQS